jgi:hypothetical protein
MLAVLARWCYRPRHSRSLPDTLQANTASLRALAAQLRSLTEAR